MAHLTLDTFISAENDIEFSQYQVLATLKKFSKLLHKNKLFPHYNELIDVNIQLELLLQQKANQTENIARKIIGIDFDKKELIYGSEYQDVLKEVNESVIEFILWAMPKINEPVQEGKAIFDFVDSNLIIKEIGITPFYQDEGYFFIEDCLTESIHIFGYEVSDILTSDISFKTFRTRYMEAWKFTNANFYDNIKNKLTKKYPHLPNPAIYSIETDIDFPFNETILPVAKRKIMRHLAA